MTNVRKKTIAMMTEQNERLSRMVKILLDMSELQIVVRDEKIMVDALVEEVLTDLEPLAQEKNIKLIGKCKDVNMVGSDILIYRLVYNLVENAIKIQSSGRAGCCDGGVERKTCFSFRRGYRKRNSRGTQKTGI